MWRRRPPPAPGGGTRGLGLGISSTSCFGNNALTCLQSLHWIVSQFTCEPNPEARYAGRSRAPPPAPPAARRNNRPSQAPGWRDPSGSAQRRSAVVDPRRWNSDRSRAWISQASDEIDQCITSNGGLLVNFTSNVLKVDPSITSNVGLLCCT